jgi:hypothetical protein
VALALWLPHGVLREHRPAAPTAAQVPPAPAAASADDLAELRRRSQALEGWIAAFSAHAPQDSRGLMAAVEIEDLIGLVDVQLDAARGSEDALPLWRQRVALLEELAAVRGNALAVAVRDEDAAPSTRRL